MTLLQSAFDSVLGLALLWLAWRALNSTDLFQAMVLFIAFGLLMALAWVRLDALDIALAEAAIGAGLTGALLLAALARLARISHRSSTTNTDLRATAGRTRCERLNIVSTMPSPFSLRAARCDTNLGALATTSGEKCGLASSNAARTGPSGSNPRIVAARMRLLLLALLCAFLIGLGAALLSLPTQAPGLSILVAANLDASGVSNPVTAVLINFRGYDTLLEMGVLLLALLGVWSLGTVPEQREPAPGAVLDLLPRLLVPVLIVVAGYLLWDGGHAPGGAFQAGSVLAAAGVLLILAGWHLGTRFAGLPQRIALVAGLGIFIAVGMASILLGGRLLEYPPNLAAALILLIEAAATLSIGITLADLFLGGRPRLGPTP